MAEMLRKDGNTHNIRRHWDLFLQYYLSTVKFNQLRFFIDITGFQFFPVDRPTYLTAVCVNHILLEVFGPIIEGLALFFDNKLMWSNINQLQMRVVYNLFQENYRSFFTYFCLNDHIGDKSIVAKELSAQYQEFIFL